MPDGFFFFFFFGNLINGRFQETIAASISCQNFDGYCTWRKGGCVGETKYFFG